jgi:hypothetical protein
MDTRMLLYLVACLVVPALWGWLMHRLFMRLRLERYLPVPTWSEPMRGAATVHDLFYQI